MQCFAHQLAVRLALLDAQPTRRQGRRHRNFHRPLACQRQRHVLKQSGIERFQLGFADIGQLGGLFEIDLAGYLDACEGGLVGDGGQADAVLSGRAMIWESASSLGT